MSRARRPSSRSRFKDRDTSGPLSGVVVRGVGVAAAGLMLSQGLYFVAYLVIARLISPAELGHYSAATVIVGLGFLLTDSGMHAALIHRRDRLDEAANTALFATVLGGLGLSGGALACAPILGAVFD